MCHRFNKLVVSFKDNCGTFDTLIPLLPHDMSFLTLDTPGHGLSSRLPPGLVYHFHIDSVILNRLIQRHFKWDKMSFMGHSMGAAICFMFAVTYPAEVDFLICLDHLKVHHTENLPDIRDQIVDNFIKLSHQAELPPRNYTWEELTQGYFKGADKSVDLDKVHYILKRNTKPSENEPGKFVLMRDPRIKMLNLYNQPHDELVECAKKLTMPVLLTKINKPNYWEKKKYFEEVFEEVKKASKDFRFYRVEGTHHVHLNNPERISGILTSFLKDYYTGDCTISKL